MTHFNITSNSNNLSLKDLPLGTWVRVKNAYGGSSDIVAIIVSKVEICEMIHLIGGYTDNSLWGKELTSFEWDESTQVERIEITEVTYKVI